MPKAFGAKSLVLAASSPASRGLVAFGWGREYHDIRQDAAASVRAVRVCPLTHRYHSLRAVGIQLLAVPVVAPLEGTEIILVHVPVLVEVHVPAPIRYVQRNVRP